MYAYVELSNVARTDSVIQSLSWMNYVVNPPINSSENATNDEITNSPISISSRDGWLATGNRNNIVSVTFTSTRADEQLTVPDRTNFNLRGHRSEIRLVSWNAPYQKLATVDEKGVIFVWVKHENRWSLELINERNHPAVDMAWSHDGRMTVICYEDGYVLVGSVAGQRYWSTVVNTPQAKLSAVTWTPDASHVILGTTTGNLILMDHHGNTTEDFSVSRHPIRQLMYSCGKFYPGAPDNNAPKYVNDDYILACSLENGHVLFLYGYQDSSPIIVDTQLQNIKLDWSCSDEILAIAGHRRITESTYHNEIQFYTRRGEFIHRVLIPQMGQILSAICWAHNNDIVFVACGTFVYTVWVTHKSLPSMLTLCQMKLKEGLLHNCLQNVDRLSLPRNLRENLLRFYRSTIKGFLPDPKNLRSFVCYPLKSNLRLQCTMKRIDLENEPSSSINTANYSGAIYVLYLEYLGGLIPLLTAKRVSKICPDFIIFDPEMTPAHLSFDSHEIREKQQRSSTIKSRSNTFDQITSIEQNRNSNSERRNNQLEDCRSLANRSSSGFSSENESDDDRNDEDDDHCRREKTSRRKPTNKYVKHKNNNRLCTIGANIWGTRFKFYGHSEFLPEVLGSVTYKTSFLHLQPRQMRVTVANNYSSRKSSSKNKEKQTHSTVNKLKSQAIRKKVVDEENINVVSSSKTNLTTSVPIAPMSPQLTNVVRSSTSNNETNSSEMKKILMNSCHRISMNTASTIIHPRHRSCQIDSSAPDSSSTSPNNLSRSTSPAASIANFIRPISPPCIQMKEALSPKFSRLTSNFVDQTCRSPPTNSIPSMTNNIDASTASATIALNIDDSSGYDSSENPHQQRSTSNNNQTTTICTVPEICFEPETYRNVHPLSIKPQKKISISDPTLNQISRTNPSNKFNENSNISASSLPEPTANEEQQIRSENELDQSNDDDDDDEEDRDENFNEKKSSTEKRCSTRRSRHKFNGPRHRIITCTSAMNDSSTRLNSNSKEKNQKSKRRNDSSEENSFYVMQNRPPLWNEQSQVYQLDFGGRVTLESAKNFQIELKGKQVIQFGRIENNCYTLDFEWPFSPLQAFAVALANITQRLK